MGVVIGMKVIDDSCRHCTRQLNSLWIWCDQYVLLLQCLAVILLLLCHLNSYIIQICFEITQGRVLNGEL